MLAIALSQITTIPALADSAPPNIIILLADDLGYGDLGCYGSENIATPHLDALAARSVRLTRYYSPSSVCSASRAGLLTGCYPPRIGIHGVISANANYGIASNETLLSELLKTAGYDTAIYGKWHLGNQPEFWPLTHGFDEWFGTIGSNDMGRGRPSLEQRRLGLAGVELVNQNAVVETNPDQSTLTQRYTDRAVAFIRRQRSNPFFLYVPFNMPHTPLFASDDFQGRSQRGLYGDVVEEIDAAAGRILEAVNEIDATDNTLFIFTSDNGPWLIFGDHGGSAGSLAGGKKQTLEGGQRVPCIASYPHRFRPAATIDTPISGVDWLPTIVDLVGAELPGEQIDGISRVDLLSGDRQGAEPPLALYYEQELRAVIAGKWKLQFQHQDKQTPDESAIGYGGVRGSVHSVTRNRALIDLEADHSESIDVSDEHPSVAAELETTAARFRTGLGDTLTNTKAQNVRPAGRVTKQKQSPIEKE